MTTRKPAGNRGSHSQSERGRRSKSVSAHQKADAPVISRARLNRALAGASASHAKQSSAPAPSPRRMLADVQARREAERHDNVASHADETADIDDVTPGRHGPRIVRPRRAVTAKPEIAKPETTKSETVAKPSGPRPRKPKHALPAKSAVARRRQARNENASKRPRAGSGNGGNGSGSGGGNGRGNAGSGGPAGWNFATLRRFVNARRVGYWAAVAVLWLGLGVVGLAFTWALELPDTQDLAVPDRAPTVTILASDGSVLARRGSGFAGAVSLDKLPPYVPHAFVAIEDRRFFSHAGIDPQGIVRAMVANLKAMSVVQGGSTITQQLAKNLFLTPERSLKRKVQETMLALWLESEYDKDELLTLYLNRVYFGAGAYGLEAAAQRFFDKPSSRLTVPEAAMLAGLVKAPSRLAPTNNPEGAQARANIVIDAMHRYGFLASPDADTAAAFPAELAPRARTEAGYAVDWIEEQLSEFVSRADNDVTVQTTLDSGLQVAAVGAIKSGLALAGEAANVSQGALVAMSPDGAVRALVGGRDYRKSQFNRATTARRQPGSAFKAFVYLTALERGMTPLTTRRDSPVKIGGYAPSNFTDRYEGQVTLMHALSKSINTVAVRLTHEATPGSVARTARRLGIVSPLQANLSLALGTSEVTLTELTSAYAPFANGGTGVFPHIIKRVMMTAADGTTETLFERTGGGPGRVVARANVGRMNAMLARTIADGTGRKAQIGRPAAGKTGTSQENRDAWFVGYTADLVAGVWVGNDNGASMVKVTGGRLPAQIWANFMTAAHTGKPIRNLPGNWQPPVAVAVAPKPAPVNENTAPAYDPRFGPPGYTPRGYQRRSPPEDEPGFFSRLFGD